MQPISGIEAVRILHIAPLIEPLGHSAPGGSEQIAVSLAAEQARRGHRVAMLCCEGSELPAGIEAVFAGIQQGMLTPIDTAKASPREADLLHQRRRMKEGKVYSLLADRIAALADAGDGFDVIHNHGFDEALLFPDDRIGSKVLHTLHCPPLLPWLTERLRELSGEQQRRYVTVSESCARDWERASGARLSVVYNGLELDAIPFSYTPDQHFAWFGRISPEKGLHTALRLAAQQSLPELKVFGRVYDVRYFEHEIRPALDRSNIKHYGFQPRAKIFPHIATARATLVPIEWEEPFGLVLIESLAAGTPVLGYRRGAAAEIVEHGHTGLLVESYEQLCDAVRKVDSLDRRACRASVLARFSVARMADEYLTRYAALN